MRIFILTFLITFAFDCRASFKSWCDEMEITAGYNQIETVCYNRVVLFGFTASKQCCWENRLYTKNVNPILNSRNLRISPNVTMTRIYKDYFNLSL